MTDLWPQLRDYAEARIAQAHATMVSSKLDPWDYGVLVGGVRALQDLFRQAEQAARPAPMIDDPRDIPDGFEA